MRGSPAAHALVRPGPPSRLPPRGWLAAAAPHPWGALHPSRRMGCPGPTLWVRTHRACRSRPRRRPRGDCVRPTRAALGRSRCVVCPPCRLRRNAPCVGPPSGGRRAVTRTGPGGPSRHAPGQPCVGCGSWPRFACPKRPSASRPALLHAPRRVVDGPEGPRRCRAPPERSSGDARVSNASLTWPAARAPGGAVVDGVLRAPPASASCVSVDACLGRAHARALTLIGSLAVPPWGSGCRRSRGPPVEPVGHRTGPPPCSVETMRGVRPAIRGRSPGCSRPKAARPTRTCSDRRACSAGSIPREEWRPSARLALPGGCGWFADLGGSVVLARAVVRPARDRLPRQGGGGWSPRCQTVRGWRLLRRGRVAPVRPSSADPRGGWWVVRASSSDFPAGLAPRGVRAVQAVEDVLQES